MATNKTYSDWFKRGGQRPVDDRLPPPPEEIEIPDEDEDDENDELREFDVELSRTQQTYQTCTVRVRATSVDEACEKAIEAAPEDDESWETHGDPDSHDLEVDGVEEL